MENNPVDLNVSGQADPIAAKLADGEAMLRAVQQAVTTVVENARKLGFLDDNYKPTK